MKINYKHIIRDTLKSPSGKWSRKNLTMFTSMVVAVIVTFIIVIWHETNAFEVLIAWLAMATGQSAFMLRDKINHRNKEDKDKEEIPQER